MATNEYLYNPVYRGGAENAGVIAEPFRGVPEGVDPKSFEMDVRGGIVATARALGIDPVDLATAISYETAGTFDPTKRGPTTQWGQHRGLIQFGEPQAQEYGVDWNNPVGSQLGENGAVAKYLRKAGVRPGMGLKDIYSAINAGAVGLYDRSDANNGGAPGTVADKVANQMEGHRAKAMALLGGEYTPQQSAQASQQTPQGPGYAPQPYTPGNYLNTPQQPQNQLAAAPGPEQRGPQVQNMLQDPRAFMRPVNHLAQQQGGFDPMTNPFLAYLRG